MEQAQLLQLIEQLDKSSLAYLNYESDDVKLTLSKEVPAQAPLVVENDTKLVPEPEKVHSIDVSVNEISNETPAETLGQTIDSPMVGVVYLKPSPDKETFVKVGDVINEGDTVVIIEAMKLMNEIQSTVSGTVVEVLVENETVVEYGQPLIRVN